MAGDGDSTRSDGVSYVLYDSSCGVCSAGASAIESIDKAGVLRPMPLEDSARLGGTLPEGLDLMREMHVLTAEGEVIMGPDSVIYVLGQTGHPRLASLLGHPLTRGAFGALYYAFAETRHVLRPPSQGGPGPHSMHMSACTRSIVFAAYLLPTLVVLVLFGAFFTYPRHDALFLATATLMTLAAGLILVHRLASVRPYPVPRHALSMYMTVWLLRGLMYAAFVFIMVFFLALYQIIPPSKFLPFYHYSAGALTLFAALMAGIRSTGHGWAVALLSSLSVSLIWLAMTVLSVSVMRIG